MRTSKKKVQNVNLIPLKQDKNRAITLLKNMLRYFPFDTHNQNFDGFFHSYQFTAFDSEAFNVLMRQMIRKGHEVENLLCLKRDYSKNRWRDAYGSDRYNEGYCDLVIDNVLNTIPELQRGSDYQETPQFTILRDFLNLLHTLLLPKSEKWIDFLSSPLDHGNSFGEFFNLRIKELDRKWLGGIIVKKGEIEKDFFEKMSNEKKTEFVNILAQRYRRTNPQTYHSANHQESLKSAFARSIKEVKIVEEELQILSANITSIQEDQGIPKTYQFKLDDLYLRFCNELSKLGIPARPVGYIPVGSTRGMYPVYNNLVEFGIQPHNIFIDLPEKDNNGEHFTFNKYSSLILDAKAFRDEINDILALYFGNGQFQIDADGILRVMGCDEEATQIRTLIRAFCDKHLEDLIPSLDKILEDERNHDWEDLVRKIRIICDDFFRCILNKNKIPYSPKDSLDKLIEATRANISIIFSFPVWCTTDPSNDFKDFLHSIKFLEKVTNPSHHTSLKKIRQDEAISIKNFSLMTLIAIVGYLK